MERLRSVDLLTESNCYILHEEGHCVVIDPNDPQAPLRMVEDAGLQADYLFLTHEHCDHMAGLKSFRERFPDAPLFISDLCNEGIQDTHRNMTSMMEVYLYFSGKPGVTYPVFTCAPAEETFDKEATLTWRGHTFRFVYLPGHTPGSTGIFLDEDDFFAGDYLLPDRDVTLRLPGGNAEDYERVTLPFLKALPKGIHVFPGHGDDFFFTGEV